MQCRMCGFEFDPMKGGSCGSCGQCKGCNKAICPRCGYGNSLSYEKEFDYISKLQKLKILLFIFAIFSKIFINYFSTFSLTIFPIFINYFSI